MVTIRPRAEADVAPAAAVLVSVHQVDGYPVEGVSEPEKWLHPNGLLAAWVAADDGGVVGHVALSSPQAGDDAACLWRAHESNDSRDVAVLGRLFVSPDARGQAIGERLVSAVMDYAEKVHLVLVLDVMEKDRAAIRLYERLGWRLIGSADHADGKGAVVPARCYAFPGVAPDHP